MKISDLLKKSLGGELVDTQFLLFSARSKRQGEVTKPQARFSSAEALAESSDYFRSLLFPSDKLLDDPAVIELRDYDTVEEAISLTDYGYASDSDLDEEEEETSATVPKDNVAKLEHSVSGSENRVPGLAQMAPIKNLAAKGQIIPNRRIMITDTAFKTWQAFMYYLYTGEIAFAPLRSQPGRTTTFASLYDPPPCSPKSMYRLACKVNDGILRDKAFAAIRSNLTEHNVIQELSSSLASRFPAILEMQVESLLQHVDTPIVINDLPILLKRIAGADLPHGADILIQLHGRMRTQHYPKTISPPPAFPTLDLKLVDDAKRKQKGNKGNMSGSPFVKNTPPTEVLLFNFGK